MPTLDGPCEALRREAWNRESDKSGADPAENDCQAAGWLSREADELIDADRATSEPDRRTSEPEQQRESMPDRALKKPFPQRRTLKPPTRRRSMRRGSRHQVPGNRQGAPPRPQGHGGR
jgi:hypothetical protein